MALRLTVMTAGRPADVAERWRQQYPKGECSEEKEVIFRRLIALKKPTVESVERVIGNRSWTNILCDICTDYRRFVVLFDDKTKVCQKCLNSARHSLACIAPNKR